IISFISPQPSLIKAIFNSDADEVRSLIFKKEDVNVQDCEKRTPLHAAAYLGDAEIIELLILSGMKGARVNAKDNKWLTPLHRAVASCSEEAVQVLLKHSADVNARDKNWQTPLHVAASHKAVRCAEALVPLLSNVNVSDRAGRTPLHHAAFSGHLEMVQLLVSRGANINAFDKKDRRAVHWAAYMGHLEVMKLLVSHGAEVCCKDKKSYSPLHAAASSGMINVVKYLLHLGVDIKEPNAYGNSALHLACFNGQDVVVNELIEAGADVNQVNEKGFSPLHFTAASRQGALCLELLIANRANINSKSKDGKTPLHMAAIHGRYSRSQAIIQNGECVIPSTARMRTETLLFIYGFSDCCRKLLSSGFDVDTPDDFGRTCLHAAAAGGTALHYAAANCNYQCVFALVGSGASVNERDIRGCGPLHYTAAADSDGKCLEYLLRNDANPALRDKDGYSAVHYASAYGHRVCLELVSLMDTSASSILHDTDVQPPISPLHLAAYHGHHHALEVLVQSLLDLDVRTPQGHTALSLAAFKGHVECVDILISQGASMMLKDYTHKRSAVHSAAINGHSECLRLLIHNTDQQTVSIRDGKGQTPLMLAVLGGHTDCVYLLLSEGASVEARDKWGRTALHRGAVMGHEACVEALLQHGSSLLVQDSRGRSPMHLAAACGHVGVLRALLKTQKTVLVLKDNCGYTPLHWACYNGHDACVELLLEHDVFQKPEGNSFSPLHCAVINDNESAAEMLIETLGPAIVNATDSQTRTPLHAAAYTDHVECLQLLLGHNAQVNAIDMLGKTALMMAAENGQTNAVEVLVSSAKADLTLQDAHRNTALHLACSKVPNTHTHTLIYIKDDSLCFSVSCLRPLHVAAGNGLTVVVQELLGKGASVLAVDENGYTPALACAPNKDVADCLALILSSMMPISPSSTRTMSSLTFTTINHYSSPSKTVTFDPLPVLRSEHVSYCKFNSLGREDGLIIPDDELNDSDSETY
uniref:Ankyrin repeat domain 28b n=1 Tax=Cyprinus carpio carpio TaxID=630221 RepID=A0A8C1B9J1_CYPCA